VTIDDLVIHFPLDGDTHNVLGDSSPHGSDQPKTEFVEGVARYAPGQIGQAVNLDGKTLIDLGDVANFGESDRFTFGAWIFPRGNEAMGILSRMDEDQAY